MEIREGVLSRITHVFEQAFHLLTTNPFKRHTASKGRHQQEVHAPCKKKMIRKAIIEDQKLKKLAIYKSQLRRKILSKKIQQAQKQILSDGQAYENLSEEGQMKELSKNRAHYKQKLKNYKKYLKTNSDESSKVDDLSCPICLETIIDPTSTHCGHTFCYKCLDESQLFGGACPICRSSIKGLEIFRCSLLQNIIQKTKQSISLYEQRLKNIRQWRERRTVCLDKIMVGGRIDVRDPDFIWCRAIVRKIFQLKGNPEAILIHYEKWNKIYDEVINVPTHRIANLDFYSARKDISRYDSRERVAGMHRRNGGESGQSGNNSSSNSDDSIFRLLNMDLELRNNLVSRVFAANPQNLLALRNSNPGSSSSPSVNQSSSGASQGLPHPQNRMSSGEQQNSSAELSSLQGPQSSSLVRVRSRNSSSQYPLSSSRAGEQINFLNGFGIQRVSSPVNTSNNGSGSGSDAENHVQRDSTSSANGPQSQTLPHISNSNPSSVGQANNSEDLQHPLQRQHGQHSSFSRQPLNTYRQQLTIHPAEPFLDGTYPNEQRSHNHFFRPRVVRNFLTSSSNNSSDVSYEQPMLYNQEMESQFVTHTNRDIQRGSNQHQEVNQESRNLSSNVPYQEQRQQYPFSSINRRPPILVASSNEFNRRPFFQSQNSSSRPIGQFESMDDNNEEFSSYDSIQPIALRDVNGRIVHYYPNPHQNAPQIVSSNTGSSDPNTATRTQEFYGRPKNSQMSTSVLISPMDSQKVQQKKAPTQPNNTATNLLNGNRQEKEASTNNAIINPIDQTDESEWEMKERNEKPLDYFSSSDKEIRSLDSKNSGLLGSVESWNQQQPYSEGDAYPVKKTEIRKYPYQNHSSNSSENAERQNFQQIAPATSERVKGKKSSKDREVLHEPLSDLSRIVLPSEYSLSDCLNTRAELAGGRQSRLTISNQIFDIPIPFIRSEDTGSQNVNQSIDREVNHATVKRKSQEKGEKKSFSPSSSHAKHWNPADRQKRLNSNVNYQLIHQNLSNLYRRQGKFIEQQAYSSPGPFKDDFYRIEPLNNLNSQTVAEFPCNLNSQKQRKQWQGSQQNLNQQQMQPEKTLNQSNKGRELGGENLEKIDIVIDPKSRLTQSIQSHPSKNIKKSEPLESERQVSSIEKEQVKKRHNASTGINTNSSSYDYNIRSDERSKGSKESSNLDVKSKRQHIKRRHEPHSSEANSSNNDSGTSKSKPQIIPEHEEEGSHHRYRDEAEAGLSSEESEQAVPFVKEEKSPTRKQKIQKKKRILKTTQK